MFYHIFQVLLSVGAQKYKIHVEPMAKALKFTPSVPGDQFCQTGTKCDCFEAAVAIFMIFLKEIFVGNSFSETGSL